MLNLQAGEDVARVDTADGGKLTSLVLAGRERLRVMPEDPGPAARTFGGSFLMAPWVGRLRDGALTFRGQTYRFKPNLGRHAIHGVAFSAPL